MYRVNVYPEFASRRREIKQRSIRSWLLLGLLGLEALVCGFIVSSAVVLGDQAESVRKRIPVLTEVLRESTQPIPGLETARAMIRVRSSRIDWSPKLAALSEHVSPELVLLELDGRLAQKKSPPKFELKGKIRDGEADMEEVTRFIETLRRDGRITDAFPEIRLGTIKGETGEFKITGGPKTEDS